MRIPTHFQNRHPNKELLLEVDEEIRIRGDDLRLRQLFLNLISNGIKYTPDNGHMEITLAMDNGFARVDISDSGMGISAEHLSHIFDRFYRVDKGRSIDTGGTGLGLAIVKHVLIRHHAELIIQSTPGQGSLFRCVFPLSQTAIEKPVDRVLS